MMVVTGGAGFVGANLVRALNKHGESDVWVVDDLGEPAKFANLLDCEIADYWDKAAFLEHVRAMRSFDPKPSAIFHQGACSDTMETDGRYVMQNNFEYSKAVLHYCLRFEIPLLYASSAAVYGVQSPCREAREFERPLNLYGYSKLLFDQYVRRRLKQAAAPVVGMRYFNVYGLREQHKGRMASMVYQLHRQLQAGGVLRLFAGNDGYADGEQCRDFIHVDDVVAVNLWFLEHDRHCGIFNVGTGHARSFNELAGAVLAWHGHGEIEYIDFPDTLHGRYQSHTEADIGALREVGCDAQFTPIDAGVPRYLDALRANANGVG